MTHTPSSQIIYTSKSITIHVHPQKLVIEVHTRGISKREELREALDHFVAYILEHNATKCLLNLREFMLFPKDFDWLMDQIQIEGRKLSKDVVVSIVMPKNLFGEYSLKKNLHTHFPEGNLSIFYFDELKDANLWLSEQ